MSNNNQKSLEEMSNFYNPPYINSFDYSNAAFGQTLGVFDSEVIKEKTEDAGLGGIGLGDQQAQSKPKQTNSKNTYVKKINNLVKSSCDNLANLEKSASNDGSNGQEKGLLRKTKSSFGLDQLNSQQNLQNGMMQGQQQQFGQGQQQQQQMQNQFQQQQQQQQGGQQQQTGQQQFMDQQMYSQMAGGQVGGVKDSQKLVRNRESARNSRKRKKIYLELLESKVSQLSEILQDSKRICCSSEKLLNNLQGQLQYKQEQQTSKQILLSNLQNSLHSNASENDIGNIVDNLKKKFGSNNPERMMVLDYCFKQIAEQMLPVHMKYILYVASESKDIFSPDQEKEEDNMDTTNNKDAEPDFPKIIQSLKLSENQRKKASKMQKKLSKEKEKLEHLVNQMFETKDKMKKELTSLDETMEKLITDFKPSQISKFLLSIERTQFTPHMKTAFQKFFEGDNDDSDDESENDLQSFMNNQESCNTLMVDVNEAYDVYTDAYEFLQKKRHISSDATSSHLNAAAQAAYTNDSN